MHFPDRFCLLLSRQTLHLINYVRFSIICFGKKKSRRRPLIACSFVAQLRIGCTITCHSLIMLSPWSFKRNIAPRVIDASFKKIMFLKNNMRCLLSVLTASSSRVNFSSLLRPSSLWPLNLLSFRCCPATKNFRCCPACSAQELY